MGKVRESPPYIVNTPEDGFFRVGLTTDAKTDRPDQVALGAGSGGCLRIFEDGGWELRSHNSSGNPNKKGCNLLADGEGPLLIKSESNIYIDCPNGDFRVNAKNIVMNATGADDGDITFNATRDIQIDADNNIELLSTNAVIQAVDTLVCHSAGWNVVSGNPVFVYEKKTKLIPTGADDLVKGILENFILL